MITISSIQEYIDSIKEISNRKAWRGIRPWFRGEKENRNSKPLLPKLYQKEYDENQIYQKFRMMAPIYREIEIPRREEIDLWLFLMRHVGLPTRLLDWTEGALIGLFFALNDADKGDKPVVWMLNTYELNRLNEIQLKSILVEYEVVYRVADLKRNEYPLTWVRKEIEYGDKTLCSNMAAECIRAAWEMDEPWVSLPVAINPTYVHPRMAVQKSRFTIHGNKKNSLNELVNNNEDILIKIVINNQSRIISDLLSDLHLLGISYSSLFPDLDGLSIELEKS